MPISIDPCMVDNKAKPVSEWIPHMRSDEFLLQSIRNGVRTAQCWTALKARNDRVNAWKAARNGN